MKFSKLTKLVAVAVSVAVVATLGLVGCGSSNSASSANKPANSEVVLLQDGKLTVAASLDFPPFENMNADTQSAEGFAVDLMNLLGEQMGLTVEYLPSTKFDAIVPMISAGGKADVGVSSFTITEDRKKEVDFTDAYMDSNQGIVVSADSPYTSVDQLVGKTIAAQSGTTGYDWAVENILDANVVAYDEMTAVFSALQSGQADAIAADLPVVQYYVKTAYPDMKIIAEIPTGEQYGIIVNKNNPALVAALNEALAAVKANGGYAELVEKWFGSASK